MSIEKKIEPNVMDKMCPSRVVLNHVTSRWGLLALIALQEKPMRFSELRRVIGSVSEKMLSQTLKTLEKDGFVHRQSFDVMPPHVEYSLTSHGKGVSLHVKALANWVETNIENLPVADATPAQ